MDFIGFTEFLAKATELNLGGKDFVICTVIVSRGHSPQKAGSKMIVMIDGEFFGTVGGGMVESRTIERAIEMLKNRESPQILDFDLSGEDGVCGGSMSIFLEGVYPGKRLIIFGAGHVSEAVCDLFKRLDYRIVVFDPRRERLDLNTFRECEKICAEYSELESYIKTDKETNLLIMTPSHQYDFEVAGKLLKMDFRFLGLLGSKRKKIELAQYLKNMGFSDEEISRVHVPVGLEINSKTPYEIAISIAAELIKVNSEHNK